MTERASQSDAEFFRQRGFGLKIGFGERPALLVIDMLKAFTNPQMMLGANLDREIEAIKPLLAVAHERNIPVIFSTVIYNDADLKDAGIWALKQKGVVTLKGDSSVQGLKLELEPACATALPFTREITGWSIKGLDIVRLHDAKGEAVIDFTEVETGIFEGVRTNEGVYILQNLAAARSLAKSMDQMIGDWAMVRGNCATVCGLTLTNNDAGSDNFQVFLKPKCDSVIASFAPTQWRLERGQILLMSDRGETWRFEADDNAQWRLVPDSADPLIMLRQ